MGKVWPKGFCKTLADHPEPNEPQRRGQLRNSGRNPPAGAGPKRYAGSIAKGGAFACGRASGPAAPNLVQ